MRATITSLVLLSLVCIPADAQISGTILRDPKTTYTIRPLAALSPVSPGTGQRGQQNLTVQLTGLNTHFSQGVTTLSMGAGITIVTPVNVISPTSASAVINIDAATAAGTRAVTVTSGAEVVSANSFSVTEIPDPLPKTCASAAGGSLGAMSPGMSRTVSGLINLPGVEDWLMVSAPSGTGVKLTLAGVGPGSEFEVSAILMCSGSPIASTTAGVTPKEILLPPGGALQTFTIRIRASQWRAESSRFTLMLVAQ